jgi:hypothetical protein
MMTRVEIIVSCDVEANVSHKAARISMITQKYRKKYIGIMEMDNKRLK